MSRTTIPTIKKKETEDEYYSLNRYSQSKLVKFEKNRWKYYKEEVLGEKDEKEEESEFILMGNLVDCLKTEGEEEFYKKYAIASVAEPVPQMKKFISFLIQNYDNYEKFSDCLLKSYEDLKEWNGGKIGTGFEKYVENFSKDGKQYFDEKLQNRGKTIVDINQATLAQELVKKIENSPIFECKGNRVINQTIVLFEVNGKPFKVKFDGIDIDDSKKILYPWDLKITNFVETFVPSKYLKDLLYIQAGLYRFSLEFFKEQNPEFKDYTIENFEFRVVDYNNTCLPLCYKCQDSHYEQSWRGFYVNNKYYKGIYQIIEELDFAEKKGEFRISLNNFNNKGIIFIPSFEQKD